MTRTRRDLLRDGLGAGAALALGSSLEWPAGAEAAIAASRQAAYAAGFTSLTSEIDLPHVPIEGDVPRWLSGALLRTGPALFEIGGRQLNHWFDGLAMLHAFAFSGGRVSYANRFLHSSAYTAWRLKDKMVYSEFGTDPCRKIFSGVSTLPVVGRVPNANVSIERYAGQFRALTELPPPVRFDQRSLRTLGIHGTAPTGQMTTAHPHHDPRTGERFSYELELLPPSGLRLVSERRGVKRKLAFIPQSRPGYMHSFSLTDRYVVVHLQPWEFDLTGFLKPTRGPIVTNFHWNASEPSRVVLVDRHRGGVAADVELESAFVFHHVNAWDEGSRVAMDVCAYPDSGIVDALYLGNLRRHNAVVPQPTVRRLTIDPGRKRIAQRPVAASRLELPRVDYATVNAKPYRYLYGLGVKNPRHSTFVDQLVKVDVDREREHHWRAADAYPGEPVFVRRPGSTREDDGVVLSVVLDAARATSYLLVLDARDLGELARATVPHHIPFGFHGMFSAR